MRDWIDLVRAPSSDLVPELMGNVRALGLHFGAAAGTIAGLAALICFAVALRRGGLSEKFSAAVLVALLLSPHTYWQDYSLLAVVAMLAASRAARYVLLAPWPFFYPRQDMLPLIFVSLAWLAMLAAGPSRALKQKRADGLVSIRPE